LVTPVRSHLSCIVPAIAWVCYLAVTLQCGSPSPAYLPYNIFYMTALMVIGWIASCKREVLLRKEWLAQRKVGTQQDLLESQYDGVCRILNLLCDCVLRLGSGLQFLEPSPRFSAMLMKGGGSLLGTCICDHIQDAAERERFSDMITGKHSLAISRSSSSSRHLLHSHRKQGRYRILGWNCGDPP